MYQEEGMVLCASSAYEKKYYLNENFETLPLRVRQELQIMCVLFTENVGGVLTLFFDEEGSLQIHVTCDEGDLLFDEIGSVLEVKRLQEEKKDLLEALETYYRVFFLGEE